MPLITATVLAYAAGLLAGFGGAFIWSALAAAFVVARGARTTRERLALAAVAVAAFATATTVRSAESRCLERLSHTNEWDVTIASDAAKVPTPGETCLGAAMAAIVTFSRTLALEAKRYGVRVNAITPSLIVDTGSYDRAMDQEFSKKIFDKITAQAHLGLTEPVDLANLVLFLASPLSRLITGQVVSVSGGLTMHG